MVSHQGDQKTGILLYFYTGVGKFDWTALSQHRVPISLFQGGTYTPS